MDDDGDAFPVLGHAAFCRNVNAQVASNGLAHWIVLYFSNLFRRVAVNTLNLVSYKLKIHVHICVHVDTPTIHMGSDENGMTFPSLRVILKWPAQSAADVAASVTHFTAYKSALFG